MPILQPIPLTPVLVASKKEETLFIYVLMINCASFPYNRLHFWFHGVDFIFLSIVCPALSSINIGNSPPTIPFRWYHSDSMSTLNLNSSRVSDLPVNSATLFEKFTKNIERKHPPMSIWGARSTIDLISI